jgi:NAD(P)H dehydrogenase (quinone)
MTGLIGVIGVTGVTGGIGGRVARRLAASGATARLVARDPSRVPNLPGAEVAQAAFRDGAAMRAALRGVQTLLLVSASESADRVAEHLSAVDAAVDAGVERVVYTSFLGAAPQATFTLARHHWQTEEHLRGVGVDHTILRDSLYLDVFAYFVGRDGAIRGPAGDGRVGAVARDDIADVATALLLTEDTGEHSRRTYTLTGPQALTLAEVAAELSRASGRVIRYEAESLEQAYTSRAHYGAPDWEVEGWVTSYHAIAVGEMDLITADVADLSGHPPMSLREHLAKDTAAAARLRELP